MKIRWWHIGLLFCLALVLLSPLASSSPDGLERVAEDKGFMERAREAPFHLIPDYVFPGVNNEAVATIMAGIMGTAAIFFLVYGLGWVLRRRKSS